MGSLLSSCVVHAAAILLSCSVSSCSRPEAPPLPPNTLTVDITIDGEGFVATVEGAAQERNQLQLPPNRDVLFQVQTRQTFASFAVPDHDIRILASERETGRGLVRTFPCPRESGCPFNAISILGAQGARVQGRMFLTSTADSSDEEPATSTANREDGEEETEETEETEEPPTNAPLEESTGQGDGTEAEAATAEEAPQGTPENGAPTTETGE